MHPFTIAATGSRGKRASASVGWPAAAASRRLLGGKRLCSMRLLLVLVLTVSASWLVLYTAAAARFSSGSAGAASPLADRVAHLHATNLGRVQSQYTGAEYWRLVVNYTRPLVSHSGLARRQYAASRGTCWEIATKHPEPVSQLYQPTQQQPSPLPGNVPRAAWQWSGRISRELFDSVPFILRDKPVQAGGRPCHHCTFVLRYKVINGQLYTDSKRRHRDLSGGEKDAKMVEGLLLAALYMYKVPDVDLLLHLGDAAPPGLPLVQPNINRSNEQAGFTVPWEMWIQGLGPQQFAVMAECLQTRYPAGPGQQQPRLARAVWRGSNTDNNIVLMDEGNVFDVMRTRLHMFGRWYPDIIDAQFTGFPQQAFAGTCVQDLLPPGELMPLEEFNRYALVLDVDGNGWSDRFRKLSHFNTPILKQASNLTGFFEHVMAPGAVMEQYAHDLSDLPARARQLLGELQQQPDRLQRMAEQQQGLAAYLLTHVPLMHAAAYTMAKVAELSSWTPAMEQGYELVPFSGCCSAAESLPEGFVQAVRAWGKSLGQPDAATKAAA